jgi:hypothetical protein
MNTIISDKEPTQKFFQKAKNKPWIVDIYIAIQAAMAFDSTKIIDLNRLADKIMPRADRLPESYIGIENEGLEALSILFVCECTEKGRTDYHEYKFTRISDGKTIRGIIKI